jgi:type IV pilus assembly protein PilM
MKQKRAIGLDIGSGNIKLVQLAIKDDIICLEKFCVKNISGLDTKEKDYREKEVLILNEIFSTHSLNRKITTNISAPSPSFTSYAKLPAVMPDQLEKIVGYEAQQRIPLPLEEMAWSYFTLNHQASGLEVVLAATRSQKITEIISVLKELKIEPEIIEQNSLALYNTLIFNNELEGNKTSIILDIGAKGTNLSVVKGKDLCLTRNFMVSSGEKITLAIQNKFGLSFEEAETLKISEGRLLSGSFEEKSMPARKRALFEVITSTFEDLIAEIRRSVVFAAQNESIDVERIYLTGGNSLLAGLDSFLEKRLSLDVVRVKPFRNILLNRVEPGIENYEATLGVAVGLALRSLRDCAVKINLLPDNIIRKREFAQKKPYLVFASMIFFLIIFIIGFLAGRDISGIKSEIKIQKRQLVKYQKNRDRIKPLKEEQDKLRVCLIDLKQLSLEKKLYLSVFYEICSVMPDGVVLDKLDILGGGKNIDAKIKGQTYVVGDLNNDEGRKKQQQNNMDMFEYRLDKSPLFTVAKKDMKSNTHPVTGKIDFNIALKVNNEIF